MAHGYHFNAVNKDVDPGRPGEPWIWTDSRTGTQIPLSYRGWKGTYHPHELGISPRQFVLQFGRQLPGGGPGEPEIEPAAEPASDPPAEQPAHAPTEAPAATTGEAAAATGEAAAATGEVARWKLSGQLNIDCMFCHAGDGSYSPEAWWEQIRNENFAWAPTAALGLGDVDGRVASLPRFRSGEGQPRLAGQTAADDLCQRAERRGEEVFSTLSAGRPIRRVTTATRRAWRTKPPHPNGRTMKTCTCGPACRAWTVIATVWSTIRFAGSRASCIRRAGRWPVSPVAAATWARATRRAGWEPPGRCTKDCRRSTSKTSGVPRAIPGRARAAGDPDPDGDGSRPGTAVA